MLTVVRKTRGKPRDCGIMKAHRNEYIVVKNDKEECFSEIGIKMKSK